MLSHAVATDPDRARCVPDCGLVKSAAVAVSDSDIGDESCTPKAALVDLLVRTVPLPG